ncbi:hypothetical protein [Rhizobium sp. PP-CC-3G-465]|uniref:hypothetical protein n=1 Tax=Rhizobium sp. PP-CC-3G-465 TaxID=2135648 RepID=UPI00104DA690|nr:hypothetical protein C8J33_11226 [Rhizobium sp. PP-CC-3G-465]
MFENIEGIKNYHVYQYQHLDDLSFMKNADEVFSNVYSRSDGKAWEAAIADLFRKNGWEGDGDIKIIWFPPFVPIAPEDTWGSYVWVVKQSNNGTAFIASEYELPFKRLRG